MPRYDAKRFATVDKTGPVALFWVLSLLAIGCTGKGQAADLTPLAGTESPPAQDKDFQAWLSKRQARLRDPEGWLTLAGLDWLAPGANRIGSDAAGDVALPPPSPSSLGEILWQKETEPTYLLRVREGQQVHVGETVHLGPVDIPLQSDAQGEATIVRLGPVSFHIIERGEKVGVRVKNRQAKSFTEFQGVKRYPFKKSWKKQAAFQPAEAGTTVPVPNVLGMSTPEPVAGQASFEVQGQVQQLLLLGSPGDSSLFTVFADQTSGKTTYGAGRFLVVAVPDGFWQRLDGDHPSGQLALELDFNRAYNPPCAFTPYATCPLPPQGNRLQVAVDAGEMNDGDHH